MLATEAAILHAGSSDLVLGSVYVDDPLAHEVLLAVTHVGLCHSDLHYMEGTLSHELPAVLGHEVTGVVERIGSGVTSLDVGDQVVVTLTPSCGRCGNCESGRPTICTRVADERQRSRPAITLADGTPLSRLAEVGGFSRHMVVPERSAIPLPKEVPAHLGCLLGCCVATGVGSVFHGARMRPGSTVAVVGCGGVGSAIIQGARLAGASEIVAIDLSDDRLAAAKVFGATSAVNASGGDLGAVIESIVPGGVDYSFEAVGSERTALMAVDVLRAGGTATIVGIAPTGTTIAIPAEALFFEEKRLIGSYLGSSQMRNDVPEYGRLYSRGALLLDELVSEVIPLGSVNSGFDQIGQGAATRVVVDMAI